MPVIIGKLSAVLTANTMKFDKGLKRSAGIVQKFGGMVGKATGLLGAFGLGLSAVGTVAFAKKMAGAIDASAKFAARVGITNEKLAGLEVAARLSGVGVGGLHSAMEKLQVRLGQIAVEGGAAAKTLQAFGLDAQQLMNLAPEKQLRVIAERMRGVQNAALRAKLAQDLFGKSGLSMINMLKSGSGELNKAQRLAEKYNLTISKFDSGKVENMSDSIEKMSMAFEGFATKILPGLATKIVALIDKMDRAMGDEKKGTGWGERLGIAGQTMAGVGYKAKAIFHALTGNDEKMGLAERMSNSQFGYARRRSNRLAGYQVPPDYSPRSEFERGLAKRVGANAAARGKMPDYRWNYGDQARKVMDTIVSKLTRFAERQLPNALRATGHVTGIGASTQDLWDRRQRERAKMEAAVAKGRQVEAAHEQAMLRARQTIGPGRERRGMAQAFNAGLVNVEALKATKDPQLTELQKQTQALEIIRAALTTTGVAMSLG